MGISLSTALTIQGDENITTSVGGPDKTGKYTGWIMGPRSHERWDPLLNTEPIYDSEEEARAAVDDIVARVRAADFSAQKDKLKGLLF
jgi:hypothetical protein